MLQTFFGLTDSQHGDELWATDGTAGGTHLVADVTPGNQDTRPNQLTPVGHTLFFTVSNSGNTGDGELWKSDGSAGGTVLVDDVIPGSNRLNPNTLTVLGDKLVFYGATTDPAHGDGLWVSDGTEAGTALLASFAAANFTPLYNIGNSLLFFADDGQHGRELWHTDGTVAGTGLVTDLAPGAGSSVATNSVLAGTGTVFAGVVDGELWFDAKTNPDAAQPFDIWKSDGTAAGTVLVASHATVFGSSGGSASDFTDVNGTAFFLGPNAIWKSDGTESGTVRVSDPGVAFATEPLANVDGTLFFAAGASASDKGVELWKTDGTPGNMTLVKDINPGGLSSSPHSFVAVGNELYFLAQTFDGSETRTHLWKSDGTEGGTQQVTFFDGTIENLTNVNGTLYFDAQLDNEANTGLWKTDGTSAGTVKIADNVDANTNVVAMDVVPAANHAPVITSDGGADTASVTVAENSTAVTTVHATDSDGQTPTYSIADGADADKFAIDASTGALSFVAAPDFENPTDADHNNSYAVQVRASDGSLSDDQAITVSVTDVNDSVPKVHWTASIDVGAHPAGWLPAGFGDFNADATDDLAWYNPTTRDIDIWKLADGKWAGSVDTGAHPAGYQPVGFGDYNHDSTNDVLWFNASTGDVDLWKTADGHWAGSVDIGTHPAGYTPSGTGDFNGDGTSDVLWYNASTHDVDLWKIADGHWAGSVDVGTHPAGYQPSLVGDFNGDGTSDIAWFNATTGDMDIWKMADGHWAGSVDVGAHSTAWQPLGAGDFNRDGTSDIVWYNPTTNDIDIWLMKDAHWAASVDIGAHPAGAVAVGVGDFDNNGVSDIAWRDIATGHIDNWMMAFS